MNKTKQLTTLSMLIALNVVLSAAAPVKVANFKFSFGALPILIGGMLYGPLEGFTIGTLGSFLYQLFFSGYGVTATTILWVIPHSISGLLVGYLAKKNDFELDRTKVIIIATLSAFEVTLLNVLALYLDAKIYGYYSATLVFANIPFKLLTGLILSILYSLFLPQLLTQIKKIAK